MPTAQSYSLCSPGFLLHAGKLTSLHVNPVPLMVIFCLFGAGRQRTAALGGLSLRREICHKGLVYVMSFGKEETPPEEGMERVRELPQRDCFIVG